MSHTDLIDNPSPRCAVALVLDTSGSMHGDPINELNAGMQVFVDEVKRDDLARWSVELAVFTAGGTATQINDFISINDIAGIQSLVASGSTPLGQATNMALQALERRKRAYRDNGVPYYQPWLVIISDGVPTDSWKEAAQQARSLAEQRKLVSLSVAVQGADVSTLQAFTPRPVPHLQGVQFRDFFQWLSASMSRVSASSSSIASVPLPPMDSWGSI